MDKSYLKQKVSPITLIFLITVLVGAAFIFLGKYHIVPGTDEIIIKRPYFGFSDIIGDVNKCTGLPYIIVMSQHPSLCRALMDAGYFPNPFE